MARESTERTTYAVEEGITDRETAVRVCSAVLHVLRPVLRRAEIDAYSEYEAAMPTEAAATQRRLREMGRDQHGRDTGMNVEVVLDGVGWAMVEQYAPWSINVELFGEGRSHLGTFHDCADSITVELTDSEAESLSQRLAGLSRVRPLADLQTPGRWRRIFQRRRHA